jgi:hypothetical protein
MSIYDSIGTSVQKVVTNALTRLGYTNPLVIFKNQNAPEPAQTYCAIHILRASAKGKPTKSIFLEDVVGNVDVGRHYAQQHYEVLLQITFVGKDSGDMAFDFKQDLAVSQLTNEDFQREAMAILTHTDVRSNPSLRETRWVDSFNMDLSLSYSVQTNENLNWVEFITVNGIQIPSPP